MQRRDQIVVAFAILVVDRRAALQDALQPDRIEHLALARGAPDFFRQCQRGAAIAIGHPDQRGAGLVIERQLAAFDLLGASPAAVRWPRHRAT